MVSDTTKVAARPEKVYEDLAKSLYKAYSPKFPSIQTSEYREYVSHFKIKTVDDFKKSLSMEKSDRGFSKMKMMETLRKDMLREKSKKVAKEVSNMGIFAVIKSEGAQNVVLVRNELTPSQLEEIRSKTIAANTRKSKTKPE
jgi:hypothetical protein